MNEFIMNEDDYIKMIETNYYLNDLITNFDHINGKCFDNMIYKLSKFQIIKLQYMKDIEDGEVKTNFEEQALLFENVINVSKLRNYLVKKYIDLTITYSHVNNGGLNGGIRDVFIQNLREYYNNNKSTKKYPIKYKNITIITPLKDKEYLKLYILNKINKNKLFTELGIIFISESIRNKSFIKNKMKSLLLFHGTFINDDIFYDTLLKSIVESVYVDNKNVSYYSGSTYDELIQNKNGKDKAIMQSYKQLLKNIYKEIKYKNIIYYSGNICNNYTNFIKFYTNSLIDINKLVDVRYIEFKKFIEIFKQYNINELDLKFFCNIKYENDELKIIRLNNYKNNGESYILFRINDKVIQLENITNIEFY